MLSGLAFDQSGSPRGAWASTGRFPRRRPLGLAVGNFANEMTALYVCDQPAAAGVLR